jgi:DNA repair protein RadD
MVVTEEFNDRFLSDTFLDASDDALIDNAMTALREQGLDLEALGFTREDLQRRFAAARERQSPQPERLIVQPQERRQALRTRLQEQTQSAANRILDRSASGPPGASLCSAAPAPPTTWAL